ncbi:hypothetical protein GQ55_3G389000, partial [Panicum hallii var. hallii]
QADGKKKLPVASSTLKKDEKEYFRFFSSRRRPPPSPDLHPKRGTPDLLLHRPRLRPSTAAPLTSTAWRPGPLPPARHPKAPSRAAPDLLRKAPRTSAPDPRPPPAPSSIQPLTGAGPLLLLPRLPPAPFPNSSAAIGTHSSPAGWSVHLLANGLCIFSQAVLQ